MKPNNLPTFENEAEEADFWDSHDSADLLEWEKAHKAHFPNLQKSSKSISIRLPQDMIEKLKIRANSLDIPYQSYIKMVLARELEKVKSA